MLWVTDIIWVIQLYRHSPVILIFEKSFARLHLHLSQGLKKIMLNSSLPLGQSALKFCLPWESLFFARRENLLECVDNWAELLFSLVSLS